MMDPFLEALLSSGDAAFGGPAGVASDVIGGYFGADPGGAGGVPYAPGQAPTIYFEGTDFELLRAMNTEQLARFQDTVVALGLAREVVPGQLDDGTLGAMRTLMAYGNRKGQTWDSVLEAIAKAGPVREEQEFEAPARLAPDYATLAQDVKGYVRQRLGREVDDYELQQLTGEMTGFYADEYEARVELARMEHEQATTPGVQAPGVVQAVDPVSRFKQVFDQRYAGEIKTVERREEFEREAPRATSIIESGLA